MRSLFYGIFFTLFGTLAIAQPINDDCSGLIDLGELPACPTTIFTNVDATASNIGFGNIPSCFNGGGTQRDVWFSFTTVDTIIDITITLTGVATGPNADAILNPQIALYRGDCSVDGLAELACISAPNGNTQLELDVLGLTPNETYFIRVNDYSASASPNWGDFTLCVDEYVPAINIGDEPSTTACFGTLYDSGGPDGDYSAGENHTFTICPNDIHQCIELTVLDFQMEPGFDELTVYAGDNVGDPVISTLTGFGNGQPFVIQASSTCVTLQFSSDGSVQDAGFELEWTCSPLACDGSSIDNPTVINSLPFNSSNYSTCDDAANFGSSPCSNDAFLNGPEYVFAYESPGDICVSVTISGASPGTGVLILNGPVDDPNTLCVAQSTTGIINAANLQLPGTYYIVVDNAAGCTDFNILVQETECQLAPGLAAALCNPLNGCIEEGGVPSIFFFEQGFQDIDVPNGSNDGCWLGVGVQPNFYWFTIQAQADGPFGFVLESADVPSDIDFSVWGPFTQQQVCETPLQVINFVTNNQPIRSSWAAGGDPTGLADIHPVLGTPVTDTWDCGNFPGAGGDDFVSTIAAQEGEVYVVLSNDWGNQIINGGISIDWSPSDPDVLIPVPTIIEGGDTTVCVGQSVQIAISSGVNNIEWIEGASTLSCDDCFDPVATPTETTVYKAIVESVCYTDTIKVEVIVFDVTAGADITVCTGEQFEIVAGADFDPALATYSWTTPAGIALSCDDCPNPTVTAVSAGNHPVIVTLTAPNCVLSDTTDDTVLPQQAPQAVVSDDQQVCTGATVGLGGPPIAGVNYFWTSQPAGFTSTLSNPSVSPAQTITYFLTATNNSCPLPSIDSVTVIVDTNPILNVSADTAICQGVPLVMGTTAIEPNTTYLWDGPALIEEPTNPNTLVYPEAAGTYILTATRGACTVTASVDVTITPIAIDILLFDTLVVCRGTTVNLQATTTPANVPAVWTPNNGTLNTTVGNSVLATPQTITTYTATVTTPGCLKTDQVTIVVDSLPSNLTTMPQDTNICEGEVLVLTTPVFEPSDFPDIDFLWQPSVGQQSPDSLLNLVVTPDTTTVYFRITTNGVCSDTTYARVEVTPIPTVSLPGDTILCQGASLQLNAVFAPDIDEITWEPADGLSCTDCPNPIATPGNDITYQVTGKLNNCPTGTSIFIDVILPPVISVPPTTEICEGDSTAALLLSAPEPMVSYEWTSPSMPNFVSNDPLQTFAPTVTTTYSLTATNECFNRSAQTTVFVVNDATVNVDDVVICAGDPLTLTAEGTAPDGVSEGYVWQVNGATLTGSTITVEGLNTSTQIILTYNYGPGCGSVNDTINVNVLGSEFAVSLTVTPSDSLLALDTLVLTADVVPPGLGGLTYTWFENDIEIGETTTSSFTHIAPFIDRADTDGEEYVYKVVVTSPEGCERFDQMPVRILPLDYKIPNVFTPNGDNRNDFFKVFFKRNFVVEELKVYNRWGQLVFEAGGNNAAWDGNYKGEPAPSDVYIYRALIKLGDQAFEEKGDVTLIR